MEHRGLTYESRSPADLRFPKYYIPSHQWLGMVEDATAGDEEESENEEQWVAVPKGVFDDLLDDAEYYSDDLNRHIADVRKSMRTIDKPEPPAFEEGQVWEFDDGSGFQIRRLTVDVNGDVMFEVEGKKPSGRSSGRNEFTMETVKGWVEDDSLRFNEQESETIREEPKEEGGLAELFG